MYGFERGSCNWEADVESILRMLENNFTELLNHSEYSAIRNGTIGEKQVNLMREGIATRVGYIVPKVRFQSLDFGLQIDLVERAKRKLNLPQEKELKPGRYPGWRAFRNIPYETVVEILKAIIE